MKIDALTGILEIEADSKDFGEVADKAVLLLEKLELTQRIGTKNNERESEETDEGSDDVKQLESRKPTNGKTKTKRRANATKSLKIIGDLLNEEQRKELRAFDAEKSAKAQHEIVAVLCAKMNEMLGKDNFSQDEIHTAIQTVNRKTPSNLGAVFNNMTTRYGFGSQESGHFVPNFKCYDYVKHDLPKSKENVD